MTRPRCHENNVNVVPEEEHVMGNELEEVEVEEEQYNEYAPQNEQGLPTGDPRDARFDRLLSMCEQLVQSQMRAAPRGRKNEMIGENFRRLQPPTFEHAIDPMDAENWLRTIESMFKLSSTNENDKVLCATFQFRGDAHRWWEIEQVTEDASTMSWNRFKEIFRNRYFTASVQEQKLNEFLGLKQGNMSVGEYIRKFEQLAYFAKHMVDTNSRKVGRFIHGLKAKLNQDLSNAGAHEMTYEKMLERAKVAEASEERVKKEAATNNHPPIPRPAQSSWNQSEKRLYQNNQRNFNAQNQQRNFNNQGSRRNFNNQGTPRNFNNQSQQRSSGGQISQSSFRPGPSNNHASSSSQQQPKKKAKTAASAQAPPPPRTCPKCGCDHYGQCFTDTRTCFFCNEVGHIATFCPKKNQNRPPPLAQSNQPRMQAQIYHATQETAEKDPNVVTGFDDQERG